MVPHPSVAEGFRSLRPQPGGLAAQRGDERLVGDGSVLPSVGRGIDGEPEQGDPQDQQDQQDHQALASELRRCHHCPIHRTSCDSREGFTDGRPAPTLQDQVCIEE